MTKLLKKRSLQSPSFRGSAKRLSSIRNKKNSDNQVSSASSVVSFSTQASTSSRLSLPSFRRPKILSRKKGKNTSSSISLSELVVEVDEEVDEVQEEKGVEESPSDKIMANTLAFFEESKTFMEENVMPKVKETLAYVEEQTQPKVQETWAYLEEQSGQCWGSPGATPTEEEEVIIIDNTVSKKMDLPVVVDADPADDLPMTYLEDHTNEEPGLEAVYQGDDSVVVGFYAEPTNDEVQEEKGVEESPSDKIMANTMAFFQESKTFMEENVMPKVKETLSYVEEHAQPKVQETWAYLEEQSGIIIDNTVSKKMDLPVVVDADPAEESSAVEDRNEAQPAADLQVMQQEIRV